MGPSSLTDLFDWPSRYSNILMSQKTYNESFKNLAENYKIVVYDSYAGTGTGSTSFKQMFLAMASATGASSVCFAFAICCSCCYCCCCFVGHMFWWWKELLSKMIPLLPPLLQRRIRHVRRSWLGCILLVDQTMCCVIYQNILQKSVIENLTLLVMHFLQKWNGSFVACAVQKDVFIV